MTSRRGPALTDERFDVAIARVLRLGVALSAAIVVAGAVIYLATEGLTTAAYGVFRGEPDSLRSIDGIVRDAAALSGPGLIQLGLLVLIATPIARVAFAMVGFARQRDWLYASFCVFVLMLLAYSLA